jgi:hypothetical protein
MYRKSTDMLAIHSQSREVPDFDNWTTDRSNRFRSSRDRFMAELARTHDENTVRTLRSRFSFHCSLCERSMRAFHHRQVFGNGDNGQFIFRLACFPGATRTFCSSQGVLHSCEKTEVGTLFELGDATSDIDVNRACRLVETVQRLCDCGNCAANRLCSHCPAQVSELRNNPGVADALAFQRECRQTAQAALLTRLSEYTGIMEQNPGLLDLLLDAAKRDDDWLNDVGVVVPERRGTQPMVEAIEEYV